MELNETPEQPRTKRKESPKQIQALKAVPTHIKTLHFSFSNEGFLFYSVILSPASNTFLYNFVAFLQIDMDLVQ